MPDGTRRGEGGDAGGGEEGGRGSYQQFTCVVRKGICCAFLRTDERTGAVGRKGFLKSLRGVLMTYKGISRVAGPEKISSQSINQSIVTETALRNHGRSWLVFIATGAIPMNRYCFATF